MSDFAIIPKLKGCFVGAIGFSGTRQEAYDKALEIVRTRRGVIWDVTTGQNEPIEQVLICEVIAELAPELRLIPRAQVAQAQQAEAAAQQPAASA